MSYKSFLFGGISGITATSLIQPIDTIKVRIQIIAENKRAGEKPSPLYAAQSILKQDGLKGFYKGLTSAWFRQATYGTTRMGLYKYLFAKIEAKNGQVTATEKIGISLFSGFLGSLVGNPSDLALVRCQSDSYLPVEQRRNYKNVFDAFYRIIKEEGLFTLWRGSTPTIFRAVSMNIGMMASYDQFKEYFSEKLSEDQNSTKIRLLSSAGSGFVSSFVSLPFDNVKTKLQKMNKLPSGLNPYNGVLDCLKKTVEKEGISGLWVGYPTYYFRVAPHAMTALLVLDYLNTNFGDKK